MKVIEIPFMIIFFAFAVSGIGISLVAWGRSNSWQKRKCYLILAGGLGFLAGVSFSIELALDADLSTGMEIRNFLPFVLLISFFSALLMVLIMFSNLKASKRKQILLQRFQSFKGEEYE